MFDCKTLLDSQKNILEIFYQNINYKKLNQIINSLAGLPKYAKIVISGVGKSENISIHFASLLNSIGIQAVPLSPLNCLHGDIGILNDIDYVIYISNSGNTKELLNIAPYVKEKCKNIIGIFTNENAKLIKYCTDYFIMPKIDELDDFNTIPSSSIIEYIVCFNIIISSLIKIKNITKEDYGNNHPEGNIGLKCNKTIKDIMITKDKLAIVDIDDDIKHCLLVICEKKLRCCIVRSNGKYVGIATDGNIRRYLAGKNGNDHNIYDSISNCVNRSPVMFDQYDKFNKLIESIKDKHSITSGIPIIDDKKNLVGLITHDQIIDNMCC